MLETLAQRLGYITEEQMAMLANVELSTLDSWRKRWKGPDWTRIGNRVLYPETALIELLSETTRSSKRSNKDLL